MRIGCLHTADSNAGVFESAARGLPVTLTHAVRAELLREAEAAGGVTPDIAARTANALRAISAGMDGVLLTCSTLGPVAETISGDATLGVPVLRVDAALAEQAVHKAGTGHLVVLYAVETTRAPTQRLFEAVTGSDPDRIAYRLVPGAWALFRAGDTAAYLRSITAAADAAFEEGAASVALAQSSMAGAATACRNGTPLTSPAAGLAAITTQIARMRRLSAS